MKDINMEMIAELNDNELLDIKNFVEAEIKVRSELKMTEKVYKLANAIQHIVDLNYTLRESTVTNATYPQYVLEDEKGVCQYRIIPDYYVYENGKDEMHYGYSLQKWSNKKKEWEDITNV